MRRFLSRKTCLTVLFAALVSLAAASPSKADSVTLFTNFGSPGQTFNTGGGAYVVGSLGGPGASVIAMPFIASQTATLTDAMLALAEVDGGAVAVYLESDSGGQPGAILDTLTTTQSLGTPAILTYTCSSCTQLVGGTEYFIVAQQTSTGSLGIPAAWVFSNSDSGTVFSNSTNSPTGPWRSSSGTLAAFEVDGTVPGAVPEPSGLVLLGTGLLGSLVPAARSKRWA